MLALLLYIRPTAAEADAVTDWNEVVSRAVLATCIAPTLNAPYETRLYAMVHIAIHDALNAIHRHSQPYVFRASGHPAASTDAAVAAAAHDVLTTVLMQLPLDCRGTGAALVADEYQQAISALEDSEARTAGLALGRAAAARVLALRSADGSDTPLIQTDFPQGTKPGEYRFTPGFDFVFAPGWGDVTPFVLRRSSQFRPRPPYNVRSRSYAADLNEIKALGGDEATGSQRTGEQTQIGLFWLESSPPQWNRIARAVSVDRSLSLWENARLFALLNVALADGYIASFDTKYHYLFWRPVTAIRLADTDDNPLTRADPHWVPLQLTYPIPDYDSAHAVEGGAAAEVLKRFFGTDHIHFTACSTTLPAGQTCADDAPVWRTYSSFSQAALENSLSRIYVGIHFRQAVEQGERHGRRIGARAVQMFFRETR